MYSWPDKADGAGSSSSTEKDIQPMSVTGSETLMADQVTYINSKCVICNGIWGKDILSLPAHYDL